MVRLLSSNRFYINTPVGYANFDIDLVVFKLVILTFLSNNNDSYFIRIAFSPKCSFLCTTQSLLRSKIYWGYGDGLPDGYIDRALTRFLRR